MIVKSRHRRGLLTIDMMFGLSIIAALITILTVATTQWPAPQNLIQML